MNQQPVILEPNIRKKFQLFFGNRIKILYNVFERNDSRIPFFAFYELFNFVFDSPAIKPETSLKYLLVILTKFVCFVFFRVLQQAIRSCSTINSHFDANCSALFTKFCFENFFKLFYVLKIFKS
jgi:hypothetical protein